ncbi:hypothetical protein Pmani_033818 [Petrolisthes manimaculis]|uniref:Uncharacterized protein n=1 Tax=Petrolisthes manimaculis TaxID=1843537 RepID=A0AAE1NNZ4_9EUCA|nr:hypothetical protein Pmani_033818 [Petrolisthes manimaculis]
MWTTLSRHRTTSTTPTPQPALRHHTHLQCVKPRLHHPRQTQHSSYSGYRTTTTLSPLHAPAAPNTGPTPTTALHTYTTAVGITNLSEPKTCTGAARGPMLLPPAFRTPRS